MLPRTTRTVLVLGAVALAWLSAPSASAHQTDPTLKAVLDSVAPFVDGVDVRLEHALAIQLVVENDTPVPVEVIDDAGEPFLKIGADGVLADVASPSWFLSSFPDGGPLPDRFVRGAPPQWSRVAVGSSWAWYDHRMHPGEGIASGPTTWAVPLRHGDQLIEVRGHFEKRRLLGAYRARVVDGENPFAQATVQVAFQGRVPGLALRNDGSEPITVLGAAGEPFARVSRAGAEVNQRSPSWWATAQSQGYDLAALELDAAAPPDWFSVSADPSFFWLEMRGLYADEEPPAGTATQGTTSLVDWTVELQQSGVAVTVRAATEWVPAPPEATAPAAPADDRSSSGINVAVVTASLVVLAVLAVLIRRRRGPRGSASRPARR